MLSFFQKPQHKGERGENLPEPNEGLPDSEKLSGLCPRCGKQSSFQLIGALPITFDGTYSVARDGTKEQELLDRVSALIFRHCNHGVAVVEEKWIGDHPARDTTKGGGIISFRGVHW